MQTPQGRGNTGQDSGTRQVAAFLFVGGGAALGYVAISSGIIALGTGIPDWIVAWVCYAAMIVPVYLAHRRLSFRSDLAHRVALPRYVVVQVAGMGLAAAASYVAFAAFGLPAVPASALVIGFVSAVNFLLLRLWAFRSEV